MSWHSNRKRSTTPWALPLIALLTITGPGCDSSNSTSTKSPLSGGGLPADGTAGDSSMTEDTSWYEYSFCVFENGTCPEGCGRAEGNLLDTEANCFGPTLPINVCYGIQGGSSGAICCFVAPDGSIYLTAGDSCSIGPHTGWKICPPEWGITQQSCQ